MSCVPHLCFNHFDFRLEPHYPAVNVSDLRLCWLHVVTMLAGWVLHLCVLIQKGTSQANTWKGIITTWVSFSLVSVHMRLLRNEKKSCSKFFAKGAEEEKRVILHQPDQSASCCGSGDPVSPWTGTTSQPLLCCGLRYPHTGRAPQRQWRPCQGYGCCPSRPLQTCPWSDPGAHWFPT